jgi:hypothetical protein
MSLIKKIDVDNYFAAKRARRLGKTGPLGHNNAAKIETSGKSANTPRSIGNRSRGRSSPMVPATVIPIVPGSGTRQSRTLLGSRQE